MPRPDRMPDRVTIQNADVRWTNFAGAEKKYNKAGERNFVIFLTEEAAEALRSQGWHIKLRKPFEDDPEQYRQPYIEVKVSYKKKAPSIITIGSLTRKRTHITEDMVELCDMFDVANWDVIIEPSFWENENGQGIKAYLHKIYMTIDEDELDLKYADDEPDYSPSED